MRMIITADWHLRASKPICRKDLDWIEKQKEALGIILYYASEYRADVMVVGDIFHSTNDTSFECVNMVQELANRLEEENLTLNVLFGNHDLPYHSSKNIYKSGVGVLLNSNNIYPIEDYCSEFTAKNFDEDNNHTKKYVFLHTLAFPTMEDMPPMIVGALSAKELHEYYPKAKWIFLGDNHHSFRVDLDGTHILNPGCLLRQTSDMKNYGCGVWFVDTDTEEIEWLKISDNEALVDDSYQDDKKYRLDKIEAFTERLKENRDFTFDFEDNVRKALVSLDDKKVRECVEKFVGIE